MPAPLLNLPDAQTGDVSAGAVGGRDVHVEGVDAAQVVDLLGARLERQLAQLVTVTSRGVVVTALLVFAHVVALLLWGMTVLVLVQPYLVAGR
jgi:hypothetical protein